MPLEPPNLDTQTYDDLVQQARLRIPRYTPDWTDFNESDPGIALIELFAWMTEMTIYELNRVPELNYIKFLQMLGLELRPAQPARAHVKFSPAAGVDVKSIPAQTQVTATPPDGGGPLIFETEAGLDLIRVPLTDVQVFDGAAFTVVTQANETGNPPYRPFGFAPSPGSALYLGFKPDDKAKPPLFPQEIRMRLFLPIVQSVPAQNAAEVASPPASPVGLVWEYHTPSNPAHWRRLNLFQDDTVGLTREGYVLLQGPSDIAATVEGRITDARYWLRCRLDSGAYPAGRVPEISMIVPNMVDAQNLATVRDEFLGASDGTPGQTFKTRRRPIYADTLVLVMDLPPAPGAAAPASQALLAPEVWNLRGDFLASGPEDSHYTLNANTGEIRFGDGTRGRIPVAAAEFTAQQYRYGGGSAGNVAAGLALTIQPKVQGVEKADLVRPAVGGQDEQTTDDLKMQAPHELRSRNRAVTAEDFTALAQQAGGVAKAVALPLAHPAHPGVEVAGAVTVIIVPDTDAPNPSPSSDQIRSVCNHLNQFRLLTTELYVDRPAYKKITVQALVEADPYAAFDAVSQGIRNEINRFLDPLGRDLSDLQAARTSGWSFGQTLHPTSLFAAILKVKNVVGVTEIKVFVDEMEWLDISTPVTLPPNGLFYGDASGHDISVIPAGRQSGT